MNCNRTVLCSLLSRLWVSRSLPPQAGGTVLNRCTEQQIGCSLLIDNSRVMDCPEGGIRVATCSPRRHSPRRNPIGHNNVIMQTFSLSTSSPTLAGTNIGAAALLLLLAVLAVPSHAFIVANPGGMVGLGRVRGKASARGASPVMMAYDVRYSPNRWAGEEIEPGFGGVWPGDPDAETHNVKFVNKDGEQVAEMDVPEDRYIYFATEDAGIDVPIVNKHKMCRNGCCTTCAAKVLEGKVTHDGALGLLKDLKLEGYALMCCSYPNSDLVVELQDEDEVYMKQFGDSFEGGGVEWGGFFLDED